MRVCVCVCVRVSVFARGYVLMCVYHVVCLSSHVCLFIVLSIITCLYTCRGHKVYLQFSNHKELKVSLDVCM